ncbi:response regulator receiver domain [Stutzerimonas chloritidismutans]|uniref:Response regulator receiver domain n=1 Tax=Stutzerimonas chloritidismutans TaxID=203192 RepID=A0ABU9MHK2_STUCH
MVEVNTFKGLVCEAFIAPLRSVLIVDDQYPTWEEIFNSRLSANNSSVDIAEASGRKSWHQSSTSAEVIGLIKEFRSRKPGFIIDIHDGVADSSTSKTAGSETPKQLADHLHQSDLLVLDYNLEGAQAGTGGDTARKILSSVLANHHFNLVVIHTSDDLEEAMHQCLLSLMGTCASQYDEKLVTEIADLEQIIADQEDAGEFSRSDVSQALDLAAYIGARHPDLGLNKAVGKFMQGAGPFSELNQLAANLELTRPQMKTFFYWAIREFEEIHIRQFTELPPDGLYWRISDGCKWLRTSRGFVCFVKKGPENLLAELEAALVDWKPTPSRLLSAKYRDAISRMGAEVEDAALKQKHAFAKFYETIKSPGSDRLVDEQMAVLRHYRLRDHVSRQSEMLSFLVEEQVADYGKRIYETDMASGFTFHAHYGVDLSDNAEKQRAVSEYNRYVCCLPSRGSDSVNNGFEQLDSGHIFKLDDSWWVCATPACDLQPGQSTIAFSQGADSSLRPFTAIRLLPEKNLSALTDRHINSGSYCYVEHEGQILALGLLSAKADSNNPAVQKVDWRAFVAKDGGVIKKGKLSLLELRLEVDDMKIRSDQKEASVIAKLRYEYALNYIQRVGVSVSRIGLGYVSS